VSMPGRLAFDALITSAPPFLLIQRREVESETYRLEEQAQRSRQTAKEATLRVAELEAKLEEQARIVREAREASTKAHLDQGLVQSMKAEIGRLREQLGTAQARLSSAVSNIDEGLSKCRAAVGCVC